MEGIIMFSKHLSLLMVSAFMILTALNAHGYDFNKHIREQQQKKDAKRWSLSEWLEQKKSNKLMDMWLMYNAPSPYEFFFGLDTSSLEQKNIQGTTETLETFRNYRGHFGAFVTLVGLYGEFEQSNEELKQWKALFMLRLLGSSDQSTALTGHFGLLNRTVTESGLERNWQHQVGGGKLQIYFLKPLALTGQYDVIIEDESNDNAMVKARGSRVEAGAHLEYGAFRIYGLWYQEKMKYDDGTSLYERHREGISFGTRFYF
jgi:hypothetical protein